MLHTYGELADAHLLQTFGFVEDLGQESNPNNTVHLPVEAVVNGCTAMAAATGAPLAPETAEARVKMLRQLGVVQHAFALPAAAPLSEELLTAAQVLLMEDEVYGEYAGSAGEGESEGLLGKAYLEDPDIAHGVCMALLRATQEATRRLPYSEDEDAALLLGADSCAWRQVCAARVRRGQRQGLQLLKEQLTELLMSLQSCDDDEDSGGEESVAEDDEEGSKYGGECAQELHVQVVSLWASCSVDSLFSAVSSALHASVGSKSSAGNAQKRPAAKRRRG